jgi:hypothetical protein
MRSESVIPIIHLCICSERSWAHTSVVACGVSAACSDLEVSTRKNARRYNTNALHVELVSRDDGTRDGRVDWRRPVLIISMIDAWCSGIDPEMIVHLDSIWETIAMKLIKTCHLKLRDHGIGSKNVRHMDNSCGNRC